MPRDVKANSSLLLIFRLLCQNEYMNHSFLKRLFIQVINLMDLKRTWYIQTMA